MHSPPARSARRATRRVPPWRQGSVAMDDDGEDDGPVVMVEAEQEEEQEGWSARQQRALHGHAVAASASTEID